jgi:hypothetical protein
MDPTINLSVTLSYLLALPGEAVLKLLESAQASPDLIRAAYEAESAGKARWPVLNTLRNWKF